MAEHSVYCYKLKLTNLILIEQMHHKKKKKKKKILDK